MIEDEGLLNSSSISSSLDEQTSLDMDPRFNQRLNHQSFVYKPNFKNEIYHKKRLNSNPSNKKKQNVMKTLLKCKKAIENLTNELEHQKSINNELLSESLQYENLPQQIS